MGSAGRRITNDAVNSHCGERKGKETEGGKQEELQALEPSGIGDDLVHGDYFGNRQVVVEGPDDLLDCRNEGRRIS